jgi:eukaryotic-like serine/threonine-protein kinase
MDLPLHWRFCTTPQAHKIEADLEKRYPEDTSVQFSYLPALRALEALNQGNPAKRSK